MPHPRFSTILLDFVEALYSTTDPVLMFAALEKACKALGYDYLSYTFMPSIVLSENTDYAPVFQISEGYDSRFIEHYVEAGFAKNDYAVNAILDMDMSVKHWWDDLGGKRLTKQEELVLQVARHDYGIGNGFTIPVYGDGHSVGGVSISSVDSSSDFLMLYQETVEIIKKISIMYSDRVLGISSARSLFDAPFLSQLSKTESLVIAMMSKGQNVKLIAHNLKLDYKYVANKIVPSIRKKMGNVSRDSMMYFAGKLAIDHLHDR